jgi:polysaccharide biosynthesis/export protein
MPNDRIIVFRDPIVRLTVFLDRLAAPFQTVVGSTLQYSFAARFVKLINVTGLGGGASSSTSRAVTNLPLEPGAR